jgi:ankyrin repeat protein
LDTDLFDRFLWAKLQLDLISRLTNDKDIREALSRLPQSLNDTYIRLLRQTATVNAENIEEVRLIIVWLVGSREPLTVKQLAEAIAINPTVKFRDVDRIATDPEDLIANLGSLVITSHIEEDVVIGLAHFTLFDFLRSDAVRDDKSIAMFHMTDTEVHSIIARACMHYLSYSDFELPCEAEQDSDMPLQDRIKSYKLLRYAAFFWPKHLRAALVQSDFNFDDFAPYLVWFTNQGLQNGLFTSWLQVFHNSTVNSEDEQPLYYAITFALWQVVDILLRGGVNVNQVFKNGLTPLQLAAAKYSQPVLRTILQYGPRVDQKSMPRGLTAMHFAAEYGRTLAVRILLEAGASPHERSSSGSTPFYRAARSGSLATLIALYEAGSDVNAATWDNWTPIFEAIECHHLRVVTRLIAWGADLTVRINNRFKPTPLEFARIYGRPDMESILGLACQGFPGIADIAESSSLDLPAGDLDDGPSDCGIEILED